MAAKQTTVVGNTGPLYRVGVPERDSNGELTGLYESMNDSNWTCRIYVELNNSDTIDRPVTTLSADGFRFLAQLTPAETILIPAGVHTVAIEVANPSTSPPFLIEQHELLELIDEVAT